MIFLCGVLVGVVAGVAGVMFIALNRYHKQCAEESKRLKGAWAGQLGANRDQYGRWVQ